MSRRLLREAKDKREAIEGIKRGLKSMKSNAGQPAAEFFREFFAEKGIADEGCCDRSLSSKSRTYDKRN